MTVEKVNAARTLAVVGNTTRAGIAFERKPPGKEPPLLHHLVVKNRIADELGRDGVPAAGMLVARRSPDVA